MSIDENKSANWIAHKPQYMYLRATRKHEKGRLLQGIKNRNWRGLGSKFLRGFGSNIFRISDVPSGSRFWFDVASVRGLAFYYFQTSASISNIRKVRSLIKLWIRSIEPILGNFPNFRDPIGVEASVRGLKLEIVVERPRIEVSTNEAFNDELLSQSN